VSLQRRRGTGADVGDGTDVTDDPAAGEIPEKPRIFDGADAVADAVRTEGIEGAADRRGADDLARMWDRADATVTGEAERRSERVGRKAVFGAADPEADQPPVAVLDAVPGRLERNVEPTVPRYVTGETHVDTGALSSLLCAVANPLNTSSQLAASETRSAGLKMPSR
jgi:hypothetical protein